jgi:prepilin-type N-terminal cleavage/methylation domain-containing protein
VRCERGFTLIELLGAMALSLVVVVAPLYFIVVSIRQQNVSSSRTAAAHRAETGLEQLARDLRQAMSQDASGNALHVMVTQTTTTATVSFDIPTPGNVTTPQAISWTCPSTGASTAGSCTRMLGSAPSTPISGVKSIVFSPTSSTGGALSLPATDPAYLGIALSVQVTSQLDAAQTHTTPGVSNPILVQTGVDLRNFA